MKAGSIIPASSRDIEDYYRELLAKADRLE
jgi:hypothetical protein